jgi:hypothetical protein
LIGSSFITDMAFILQCLLLYVIVQLLRVKDEEWAEMFRMITGREPVAQTPVAALPAAKPAPRRRTRKAAA